MFTDEWLSQTIVPDTERPRWSFFKDWPAEDLKRLAERRHSNVLRTQGTRWNEAPKDEQDHEK